MAQQVLKLCLLVGSERGWQAALPQGQDKAVQQAAVQIIGHRGVAGQRCRTAGCPAGLGIAGLVRAASTACTVGATAAQQRCRSRVETGQEAVQASTHCQPRAPASADGNGRRLRWEAQGAVRQSQAA